MTHILGKKPWTLVKNVYDFERQRQCSLSNMDSYSNICASSQNRIALLALNMLYWQNILSPNLVAKALLGLERWSNMHLWSRIRVKLKYHKPSIPRVHMLWALYPHSRIKIVALGKGSESILLFPVFVLNGA